MKKISQREARKLRKRVQELEKRNEQYSIGPCGAVDLSVVRALARHINRVCDAVKL